MTVPTHVAIIMDGNGRWAAQRGWPRIKGHKAGVLAVERILEAASDAGIRHLSLYAFSTENWKRPPLEVGALMALLRMYLRMFVHQLRKKDIRFHHLGALEGMPAGIQADMKALERATASNMGKRAFDRGSCVFLILPTRSSFIGPPPLTFCHQVVDVPGLDELCRAFADGQCLEVSFATINLGAFLLAQVLGKEAALGFHYEV